MTVHTATVPKAEGQMVSHTQLVFDEKGNIVLSKKLSPRDQQGHPRTGRHRIQIGEEDLHYILCLGDMLFT